MKNGLFIFSFILSIGFTVLGLMTAYRLKNQQDKPYGASLFYYTVLLASFGFYSIWSFITFQFLLNSVISSKETLFNIVAIFPFMGFPLLVIAWFLYLQFCVELIGKKIRRYLVIIYFTIFFILFLIIGNQFRSQLIQDEAVKLLLIFKSIGGLNLMFFLFGTGLIFSKSTQKNSFSLYQLTLTLMLPALLSSIALFMSSSHWFYTVLFVLFYFSQIAMTPTYIYFKTSSSSAISQTSFEDFCGRYEISKREAEIIVEISKGKTNKAIANALFITTQTVKDHAHRIYTKTGVRNRVQLTNMVREKIKSEPTKSKP